MMLNVDKCKVMYFGRTNNRDKYNMKDSYGKWNEMSNSDTERDRYYGIIRSELGGADRKCFQESEQNTWYAKKDILQLRPEIVEESLSHL